MLFRSERELQTDLATALQKISTRHRAAVVLRFQEGLSVAEAAAILELPGATVRTHTARGLRELREALGNPAHPSARSDLPPRAVPKVGGGAQSSRPKERTDSN